MTDRRPSSQPTSSVHQMRTFLAMPGVYTCRRACLKRGCNERGAMKYRAVRCLPGTARLGQVMRDADARTSWHAEETYKGLIQIALSALRFAVFANGGAAVALLAFLGKEGGAALALGTLKAAMGFFIGGVALGGFAHVTAYLTQLRLYAESALREPQVGWLRHNTFLYLTLGLGFASIVAFALGAWCGVAAIQPVAATFNE
jgi:hypothetical protein